MIAVESIKIAAAFSIMCVAAAAMLTLRGKNVQNGHFEFQLSI